MSPTVNNFVHDLVAMAKAMEDLPIVQEKLDQANNLISRYAEDVQAREESILRLKAEAETLHSTIRKVEAEREEAILSFLDADDRTKRALDFVKSTFGSAGSLIQALEPPTPAPMAVPADAPAPLSPSTPFFDAVADAPSQGQSEPLPPATVTDTSIQSQPAERSEPASLAHTSLPDPGPAIGSAFTFHGDPTNVDSVSVGERVVDPTAQGVSGNDGLSAGSTGAHSIESASASTTSNISPADDVGYHNEPTLTTENGSWDKWDAWAARMNNRYGSGSWPRRA